MVPWWRTTFGEEELARIAEAIRGEHISQGPIVAEFERRMAGILGTRHVIATTSGSMSLLMACMAVGVGPGDEVIVPNRTWIATAHAPYLLGAKVVLVDIEKHRPCLDCTQLEAAITPRTKAIIPVHLNGRACDMNHIRQLAVRHHLKVIEDAAQALGSRPEGVQLGTRSDIGCFSLSVAKIIATGQGGYACTNDDTLAARMRSIRTHGVADVIEARWVEPGFNFRFTDIQASIGLAQLDRLPGRIGRVLALYERYRGMLESVPGVSLIPVDVGSGEIPTYIEVLCESREHLRAHLLRDGIESRPFYPALNEAGYFNNTGRYPNSEPFSNRGLYLPSGPEQSTENIDRTLASLAAYRPPSQC